MEKTMILPVWNLSSEVLIKNKTVLEGRSEYVPFEVHRQCRKRIECF
jgi:hypothetical protein